MRFICPQSPWLPQLDRALAIALFLLCTGLVPKLANATDLIFQRPDGTFRLWHVEGRETTGPLPITPNHANHDSRWRLVGAGMFNGAGNADLLFQYHDGLLAVWFMDSLVQSGSTLFYPDKPDSPKWRLIGSGDLDGDGAQDLIFQGSDAQPGGQLMAWLMRGPHQAQPFSLSPKAPEPGFQLRAIGDLDGDQKADLVFQEPESGKLQMWLMNGVTRRASATPEPAASQRGLLVQAAVDFDEDGLADLIFQKQRELRLWKMNRTQRVGEAVEIAVPGLDPNETLAAAGAFLRTGTVPKPPPSREQDSPANRSRRLSRWTVNPLGFGNERGDPPIRADAVSMIDEGGVRSANILEPASLLLLPTQSADGRPLMAFRPGTLKFRFRPEWTRRHNIGGRGSGPGPGGPATLLSVGDPIRRPEAGWLELAVSAQADALSFRSRNQFGHEFALLYEAASGALRHLQFESNSWTEFTLVLETNRIEIWQEDHLLASTNTGTTVPLPPESVVRGGLCLGNVISGGQPARGAFDDLECFSYPFGVFEHSAFHVVASVSNAPQGILLEWKRNPFRKLSIRRRLLNEPSPALLTTNVSGLSWIDKTAAPGERYEYTIFDPRLPDRVSGTITASLEGIPEEYRGRALVLVDETLEGSLAQELREFEKDLIGDGWFVTRRSTPRHHDTRWSVNPAAIGKVRAMVQEEYQAARGELRTVILVGHVAVPYTGFGAEDGHIARGENHFGAWPSDLYYADTDGHWTDIDSYPLSYETFYPETKNVPGDGKFDQSQVPRNAAGKPFIEVSVGRIDFARLEGYLGERLSEIAMLKRYFDKNHRYRHGELAFPARAIVESFSHPNENRILFNNAIYNSRRNFGPDPDALVVGDFTRLKQAALWGFQAGFGAVNVMNNNQANPWSTESITRPSQAPSVAFYMLSGSWFGDWNLAGNLLRGMLVPANSGLASCWMRGHLVRFDRMATGGTIGDAWMATANDPHQAATVFGAPRTLSLLGDPSLRSSIVPPPGPARVSKGERGSIVTWAKAAGQPMGYFVYASPFALGPFTNRLTERLIQETQFTDTHTDHAARYYAVRAALLATTGGGSYTNLSQASFARKGN